MRVTARPILLVSQAMLAILGCAAPERGARPTSAAAARAPATRPLELYDGFESDDLSGIWDRRTFEPGALELQSDVVRAGWRAAKITIRRGDRFDPGRPDRSSIDNERDELLERRDLYAREGDAWSYSFSLLLPRDFPIVDTRLVLASWKQYDRGRALIDNPVIALRYTGGETRITLKTGDEQTTLWRTRQEMRGRWLDFVWQIRFARTDGGFLRAWLDGRQIVDHRGRTAYDERFGYEPDGEFYFKVGLYRDTMDDPMTVYVDEYRKRRLQDAME